MTSSTLSIIVPICALLITIGVIVYKAGKLSNQIGQIDQKFDQKFQHLSDLLVSHKVKNEKEFHLVREDIQSLRSDVKDLRDVVFDLRGLEIIKYPKGVKQRKCRQTTFQGQADGRFSLPRLALLS